MAKTIRKPVGADTDTKKRLPIADKRDRMAFTNDPTKKRVVVTEKYLRDYLDSGFNHVRWEDIDRVGEGNFEAGSKMGTYVNWNVGRADGIENARGWLLEMDIGMWLNEVKPQIEAARRSPLDDIKRKVKNLQDMKDDFYGEGLNLKGQNYES